MFPLLALKMEGAGQSRKPVEAGGGWVGRVGGGRRGGKIFL